MKQPTPAQLKYWQSKRALTPEQEQEIKLAYNVPLHERPTYKTLAKRYGVSHNTIFLVINKPPTYSTTNN